MARESAAQTGQPCQTYTGRLCTCYRTVCVCPVDCELCGWSMWLHGAAPTSTTTQEADDAHH